MSTRGDLVQCRPGTVRWHGRKGVWVECLIFGKVEMTRYSASERSVGRMFDFLEKWECPDSV
jgi:hypothetical protein